MYLFLRLIVDSRSSKWIESKHVGWIFDENWWGEILEILWNWQPLKICLSISERGPATSFLSDNFYINLIIRTFYSRKQSDKSQNEEKIDSDDEELTFTSINSSSTMCNVLDTLIFEGKK